MRIALLNDAAELGGAERYFADLARGASFAGHEVHVVLSARGVGQQARHLDRMVASIMWLPAGIRPLGVALASYFGASRYLGRLRPDVAHFSLHHADSCRYWIEAARRLRVPFLLTEHVVAQRHLRASRLTRWFKTRAYLDAGAVLFVAESALALTLADWRGRPPRAVVVPPGVRIDNFRDDVERSGMSVCFVGRLSKEKDPVTAVRAFATIAADFPEATLHIYGDGPLRNLVAEEISRCEAGNRIVMYGHTDAIADALARADVLLLASRFESLPYAVLEAMASRCAVVATSVGDLPTVLDGGAGVVVAPGDVSALAAALSRFLADRSAVLQAGARGRQRVEALYTFDRMIQATLRLYHSSDQQRGRLQ